MIISVDELLNRIQKLKDNNNKIVFTNGCFDILHAGHCMYLNEAKSLGDVLIVGLNTDNSIKRIKSVDNLRPINNEINRASVLDSLRAVDYVVLFDEDTPYNLISTIVPDVLVKGNDYSVDNIVGADVVKNNGGSVKTIDLLKGQSTTNIIEKIKQTIKYENK